MNATDRYAVLRYVYDPRERQYMPQPSEFRATLTAARRHAAACLKVDAAHPEIYDCLTGEYVQ